MLQIRRILQLKSQGKSNRDIAREGIGVADSQLAAAQFDDARSAADLAAADKRDLLARHP